MRTIVLFGAGKSSTYLIEYLMRRAAKENWRLIVIDSHLELVLEKLKEFDGATALSFDVLDEQLRRQYIQLADLVISLMPPALHYLIAGDCISFRKHLLTASYVDQQLKEMHNSVASEGILFLCEMGLDPGIDHMSAMHIIDSIHRENGTINSFFSCCGGLVAPESDDNPWHYKISWNPKNLVNAGKQGARYQQNGRIEEITYNHIFSERKYIKVVNDQPYCWYPNRDSIPYMQLYNLRDCTSFIRATLRHPDFMYGWKNVVDLRLTDESLFYDTDDRTLKEFFKEHMDSNNFGKWLEQKLQQQLEETNGLLKNLVKLVEKHEHAESSDIDDELMLVNEKGDLEEIDIDDLKTNAAAVIAARMHDSKLTLQQLFYLGLDDDKTIINKGKCSAADVLQFALEKKLALKQGDRDMVLMQHKIGYHQQGKEKLLTSTLVVKGEDEMKTAMAKCVGLPLAIAAKLILNGHLQLTGIHIPIREEIYKPILQELAEHNIQFTEIHEQ
ncbi:MAG TPA: saccharopine dehydrogenase C-terminal domain-containing protein [Chitinophagaceae bacterium]|nr:saccharopine dehydrogenase C-terminal domain-containing protein [Chitinophagaceae bacterium]